MVDFELSDASKGKKMRSESNRQRGIIHGAAQRRQQQRHTANTDFLVIQSFLRWHLFESALLSLFSSISLSLPRTVDDPSLPTSPDSLSTWQNPKEHLEHYYCVIIVAGSKCTVADKFDSSLFFCCFCSAEFIRTNGHVSCRLALRLNNNLPKIEKNGKFEKWKRPEKKINYAMSYLKRH